MPWVKEKPITPVPEEILPQKKIIAEKKPQTMQHMLPPGLCPPFEIFIAGFFLGGSVPGDHRVDFRSKMHRQTKILY